MAQRYSVCVGRTPSERGRSLALPGLVDLFLAICQGLGLALAAGLSGLLAPLFASVLAHVDVGWKLDGTSWDFVASEWFIAVLFALNVAGYLVRARKSAQPLVLIVLVALGAVLFAASLAEEGAAAWPGLIAGALVALFAGLLTRDVLAGAAQRSPAEDGPRDADGTSMVLFAAGAGLILVLVSLFIPPLSILALVGLLVLAVSRQRRAGRKYEGLRVLR